MRSREMLKKRNYGEESKWGRRPCSVVTQKLFNFISLGSY